MLRSISHKGPRGHKGFSVNIDFFKPLILLSLALNLGLSIGVVVVEEVRLGGGLSDVRAKEDDG